MMAPVFFATRDCADQRNYKSRAKPSGWVKLPKIGRQSRVNRGFQMPATDICGEMDIDALKKRPEAPTAPKKTIQTNESKNLLLTLSESCKKPRLA